MSEEAATLPYDLRLRRRNLVKALRRIQHDVGIAKDEARDLAYDQPDSRSAGDVKAYMVVAGILEEVQPLLVLALENLEEED